MYSTLVSVLYRNLDSKEWLHHYYHKDLYTLERLLIYEYAKTSLYEKQKLLGMLSPYAEPYHHVTEESTCEEKRIEKKTEARKEDSEAENNTLKN